MLARSFLRSGTVAQSTSQPRGEEGEAATGEGGGHKSTVVLVHGNGIRLHHSIPPKKPKYNTVIYNVESRYKVLQVPVYAFPPSLPYTATVQFLLLVYSPHTLPFRWRRGREYAGIERPPSNSLLYE